MGEHVMYGPPEVAAAPARINPLAVVSIVFTGLAALCVLGGFVMLSQVHGEETLGLGYLGVFAIVGSLPVAAVALILGLCAIASHKRTRGLGLSVTSVVLSGGWVLLAVGWIALTAGKH